MVSFTKEQDVISLYKAFRNLIHPHKCWWRELPDTCLVAKDGLEDARLPRECRICGRLQILNASCSATMNDVWWSDADAAGLRKPDTDRCSERVSTT